MNYRAGVEDRLRTRSQNSRRRQPSRASPSAASKLRRSGSMLPSPHPTLPPWRPVQAVRRGRTWGPWPCRPRSGAPRVRGGGQAGPSGRHRDPTCPRDHAHKVLLMPPPKGSVEPDDPYGAAPCGTQWAAERPALTWPEDPQPALAGCETDLARTAPERRRRL